MSTKFYKAGDSWKADFATYGAAGIDTSADSLPSGFIKRNGTKDAAVTVTIARDGSTNQYLAGATIPGTYSAGDLLSLWVVVSVAGISSTVVIDAIRLVGIDSTVSKLPATVAAADVSGTLSVNTAQWGGSGLPTSFSASNLPSDYQQRGIAVTLPTAPSGYGGATLAQIAGAILANPTYPIGTSADNSIKLPATPPSGYGPGLGTGLIAVNENTGGTDALRYVDSTGNGISGATILLYLASDWPANPAHAIATAQTRSDGRWASPCYLSSGTYVAVFSFAGSSDASPAFTL